MQPDFPFLFHQRLHCGFRLATILNGLRASRRPCSEYYTDKMQTSQLGWFAFTVVQLKACLFQVFSKKQSNVTVSAVVETSVMFWKSPSVTIFSRHWGIPLLHLYTTEDHSQCSFRLSAGGAPPSGLCGRWRTLKCEQKLSSALITSDNRTIDQMMADKLSRVEWPEEGRRK